MAGPAYSIAVHSSKGTGSKMSALPYHPAGNSDILGA